MFPQSADLNSMYGDLQYFLRHDAQTAYKHYQLAIESDPAHVPAACGLATVMLELGIEHIGTANEAASPGSGRNLHAVCESWLAYRKEYAAAMFAYGSWLEQRRGDVSGAEECYRIAIEHGRQKKHWLTRAPFSQNCREWFEAKDRVWIQARALTRLAVLLHGVHNKSEAAEAALDEAHRVDAQYADAYFVHGQILASKGVEACVQAEILLRAAIGVNRSHVPALFECAKVLHHLKNEPYEAERMYRQCLHEDAHHTGALSQYALLLDKSLADQPGALSMCKRALALDSTNLQMLSLYARLLLDVQGDFAQAERIFRNVLERDLSCVEALHHYGRLLSDVHHDLAGAERMYRRALLVDDTHVPTLTKLGRILEQLYRDIDGAEALYIRALHADSNDYQALLNHGKLLHFARGDINGAQRKDLYAHKCVQICVCVYTY